MDDTADVLSAAHFRAQELARRTVEYHRQRESEQRSRERYGRRFTTFPWTDAAAAVLADEALEDEASVMALIRELGRQGCCEVAMAALDLVLSRGSPPPSKAIFDCALRVAATEYQDELAGQLFGRMSSLGLGPDLLSANLLLGCLCCRGRLGPALELLARMRGEMGLAPNSYSVLMVLQACNYKRRGAYREAIEAVQALDGGEEDANEDVMEALLQVCEAAMHKAPSFEAACAVFRSLLSEGLPAASWPLVRARAYNALLGAAGRAGAWREAQELYGAMGEEGLPPSLETHTALIQACVVGRALDHALELFEGLVAGRSASEAVPASIATYNHLIHACHQAGMLEKALEIASWVSATGVPFDDETYGELMATIDVAQLWDDKAVKQAVHRRGALLPSHLRPAPYDSMRVMYLDHLQALQQEEVLAREKLGPQGMWGPRSLTRGTPSGTGPAQAQEWGPGLGSPPARGGPGAGAGAGAGPGPSRSAGSGLNLSLSLPPRRSGNGIVVSAWMPATARSMDVSTSGGAPPGRELPAGRGEGGTGGPGPMGRSVSRGDPSLFAFLPGAGSLPGPGGQRQGLESRGGGSGCSSGSGSRGSDSAAAVSPSSSIRVSPSDAAAPAAPSPPSSSSGPNRPASPRVAWPARPRTGGGATSGGEGSNAGAPPGQPQPEAWSASGGSLPPLTEPQTPGAGQGGGSGAGFGAFGSSSRTGSQAPAYLQRGRAASQVPLVVGGSGGGSIGGGSIGGGSGRKSAGGSEFVPSPLPRMVPAAAALQQRPSLKGPLSQFASQMGLRLEQSQVAGTQPSKPSRMAASAGAGATS